MKPVDFGQVAGHYAKWNDVYPDSVFDRLLDLGVIGPSKQVADLGCGSGTSSRLLALRGCEVTGVEPSLEMLEEAQKSEGTGSIRIRYVQAPAEQTGLPEAAFDAVTAFRAWHWFDREKAILEVRRILKPGGWLVVSNSVFFSAKSELFRETKEIITRHSPGGEFKQPGSTAGVKEWKHGFPTTWFTEWEQGGFRLEEAWEEEYTVRFTPEGWRGRVQGLSNLAAMNPETRKRVDEELKVLLESKYTGQQLDLPHLCSTVVLQKR
jgi:ubiquinone/menaquinone biosynthesis C-methylase UbiE